MYRYSQADPNFEHSTRRLDRTELTAASLPVRSDRFAIPALLLLWSLSTDYDKYAKVSMEFKESVR